MPRRRHAALAALLALPIGIAAFAHPVAHATTGARLLDEVLSSVSARFVDTVATQQLYEKAARGLVAELNDPYSELFTPKDLAEFTRTTVGRYAGVGMLLTPPIAGFVMVEKVFPGTPAERRGVQVGDRITAIDGTPVEGWPVDRVQARLLGEAGTPVTVTYRRAGVGAPIVHQFRRATIVVPPVPFRVMLADQVGYVPLARFGERSTQSIAEAITGLRAGGARRLILDLRGNPGGIVEEALGTSNLFLPKGAELLSVRERSGAQSAVAQFEAFAPDMPLVVLVDGGSASASEIVAGALQDHDRALVLGTTTYGKGLVQSVFPLDGGYALKLTTGRWFTPSGRSIQKPRHYDAARRWVEDVPDSLETSAVRAGRPTYRSTGGRTLYGGGAITPDLIVPDDTITSPEQALRRLLAPHAQRWFDELTALAESLKGRVRPDFTVDPAWRGALYQRLVADSVRIARAAFEAGSDDVDRAIEHRVATVLFGDSIALRHRVRDDRQLRRAVALLHGATTQAQVFAAAERP